MDPLILTLDDFTFQDAEIPEQITFGGEQKLAVHRLVGGSRVVDAMGRDDGALEWSGLFLGTDAVRRARHLDGLRISGRALDLTWSEFSYKVVVKSFRAPFERFYKIPYTISCEVVQDNSTPNTAQATPGAQELVKADMNPAKAIVARLADSTLTQALGNIDSVLSKIPGGSKISPSVREKLTSLMHDAQQRVNDLIDANDANVRAIMALADAQSLTLQFSYMQKLSDLLQLKGLMGRMINNVGVALDGTLTITKGGGTLFDLSARQYGGPTQWTAIATANGLADPFIAGIQQLIVPTLPDSNNGVLQA